MSGERTERPNVVVLLMDCVRNSDFPPPPAEEGPAKGLESVLSQMVSYPRAATVSPWTIPSHASLFTGLYPWVHGVHHKGRSRLPSSIPRIASVLRAEGYETLSLSGNAFLTPSSGLVDGFETLGWCRWIDPYVRVSRNRPPAYFGPCEEAARREEEYRRSAFISSLKSFAASGILEFPFVVDAVNRIIARVENRNDGYRVSPWIEAAFEEWVASRPSAHPIFAFVNLVDAHDPYLTDPNLVRTISGWWKFAHVKQLPGDFYLNRWTPSREERNALHEMYVRGIRAACGRALNLVSILKSKNRWENTLFIITSDHGNAFGEDGLFFHGLRVTEPVARIPLWIRFPFAERAGAVARGWASLIDIYPTALEETRCPVPSPTPGVNLRRLIDRPRSGPVLVASDGVQATIRKRNLVSDEVIRRLDRVWVAAYEEDRKVVFDASTGTLTSLVLDRAKSPSLDGWRSENGGVSDLAQTVRAVGRAMLATPEMPEDRSTSDRLASWGYT